MSQEDLTAAAEYESWANTELDFDVPSTAILDETSSHAIQTTEYSNSEFVNSMAPDQSPLSPITLFVAYSATPSSSVAPSLTSSTTTTPITTSPTPSNLHPTSLQDAMHPNLLNGEETGIPPNSFHHHYHRNNSDPRTLSRQSSVDFVDYSQPYYYVNEYDPSFEYQLAVEDEKRRRNTAASARFRVKKKMREQALERTAKDMTAKTEQLENKIKELELEIKWLRSLIIEKDPKLLDIERPKKKQKTGDDDDSGGEQETDQTVQE